VDIRRAQYSDGGLARCLYVDLMVSLAGPEAQRHAGHLTNYGHEHDIEKAIDCATALARIEAGLPPEFGPDGQEELNLGDPLHTASSAKIIDRAQTEVVALLKDNWLAVERVATELRRRDYLVQAELDHVIANGRRKLNKQERHLIDLLRQQAMDPIPDCAISIEYRDGAWEIFIRGMAGGARGMGRTFEAAWDDYCKAETFDLSFPPA
jgi:hypothetical protein